MRRYQELLVVCLAILMTGCDHQSITADTAQEHLRPQRPNFAMTALDPIAVEISGPAGFAASDAYPQTAQYTAQVSNGTGPYYYHWAIRYCQYYESNSYGEPGEECWTTYQGILDGQGLSTVTVDVWYEVTKFDLLLEVRETQTGYVTGVGGIEVYGPYHGRSFFPPPSNSPFVCSRGFGWYPFEERDSEGKVKYYRRNACSGAREYQN